MRDSGSATGRTMTTNGSSIDWMPVDARDAMDAVEVVVPVDAMDAVVPENKHKKKGLHESCSPTTLTCVITLQRLLRQGKLMRMFRTVRTCPDR